MCEGGETISFRCSIQVKYLKSGMKRKCNKKEIKIQIIEKRSIENKK